MTSLPTTFKRLRSHTLTSNFRKAVKIETAEMIHPSKGEVLVKNKYVGINAGEVNVAKGRYLCDGIPPIDLGFEAIGEIVELGEGVKNVKLGQFVAYIDFKRTCYAEYTRIGAEKLIVIPSLAPEYLAILLCGLTSSIGLEKDGEIKAGETVLINGAAGQCGHIAVQWAKNIGCHVIATCSTEEKVKYLKDLGCDRVVNYTKEKLADVLAKEYKDGVNLVWDPVGGELFEAGFNNLSIKGRLIVIGGIAGYMTEEKHGFPKTDLPYFGETLLFKNASVKGFILIFYEEYFASYFNAMSEMMKSGKLKVRVDTGEKSTGEEFFGLEGVIRAIEHIYSKNSIGKMVSRMY